MTPPELGRADEDEDGEEEEVGGEAEEDSVSLPEEVDSSEVEVK